MPEPARVCRGDAPCVRCKTRPGSPTLRGYCPPCFKRGEREGTIDAQIAAQYKPEFTMPLFEVPVILGEFKP